MDHKSCVPGMLTVEYKSETGQILHKTFHASSSPENDAAGNHATDINVPSTSEAPPDNSSPPLESRLEYKHLLEYREVNRHARRKIAGWLNDGWRVSWEWNGLHNYKSGSSKWKCNGDEYRSARWMNLRMTKENFPTSTLSQKIPEDPNHSKGDQAVYPDVDSDSDTE